MAEHNGNGSMTAMLNGKTISLGMFNGKTVFGGAADITLSGTVSTNEANVTPTQRSYSVSGSASDTGTYQVVFNAASEYSWPSGASVSVSGQSSSNGSTSFSFNAARTQLTITQSYTIPSADETDNWSWSSTNLVLNTYGGNITYSIPDNTSISNQTTSYSSALNGTINWTATLNADTNYVFSDNTTTKVITGSFTNPNNNSNQNINLDTAANAVDSTLRTVTLSPTDNIPGANYTLSKTSVTGVKGYQEDVTLTISATSSNTYFESLPTISGNDYFTVVSTTGSNPLYSGTDFDTEVAIVLRVTVQSSNVTDSFNINGSVSSVKSVMWQGDTQSVPFTSNNNFDSLTFYSTDPEGEPPTVTENVSWLSVGTLTYSGGVGHAQLSVDANNLSQSRNATVTIESGIDGVTDTYILTQAAQPQVAATSATFQEDTSKAERYVIDTQNSSGETFTFTTLPVNGLVAVTTIGAPSGVSVSLNNANNTVFVSTPNMVTGNMRVVLHPQGNTGLVLDELWLSLQTEV